MSITILNTNPNSNYTLDDFDETKNYHRVLFKPGVAVQARELTQMQTSLQKQIDYHGQYSFNDGSRVVGGKLSINTDYDFVKLEDVFGTSSVAYNTASYMADFKDNIIEGVTSGVKARVLQVINSAGTDVNDSTVTGVLAASGSSDNITAYVQYIEGDGSTGTNKKFIGGEVLQLTSNNAKKARVCGFANGDGSTASTAEYVGAASQASGTTSASAIGKSSIANIEEGAYFIKGTFVYVKGQSLVLDKYTNTPNYYIGLNVTETVVTSIVDSTLNDNAAGTTNVSAPGADRYKIDTKLIKTAKDQTPNSEFTSYVLLLTIEDGIIASDKSDKNNTTELTQKLARRTFEESGNYSTSGFKYDVREYLNTGGGNNGYKNAAAIIADGDGGDTAAAETFGENRLAFGIAPNTIYVDGFRVQNTKTKYITLEKPRTDTVSKNDLQMEINYGDFFLVRSSTMKGMPDINNFTIATMQNTANDSTAIAHFATVTGAGVTGSRTKQTTKYTQLNTNATNNFTKTAADGTTSTVSLTRTNPGSSSGLEFKMHIDYAGVATFEIISGGTGYGATYDVTIPASETGSGVIKLDAPVLGLGTCRFRSLEKHTLSDTNAANFALRLHVFDIKMTSGSLTQVGRFNQEHEGGTSNTEFTDFFASTATTADDGILAAQEGKLYSNVRNSTNAQVFELPYKSIKSLGAETSPAEAPRVRLKKKYKFEKTQVTDDTVVIGLSPGETLFGSTAIVTQDDTAGVIIAGASGTTSVTVTLGNTENDDGDGNVILTIEKQAAVGNHGNNPSLRTKIIAYSDTNLAPFADYTFDGSSPIMLNKPDIQKVYYAYNQAKRIAGTGHTAAGDQGATSLTLSADITSTIIPGMNVVTKASDEGNTVPIGFGKVISVTTTASKTVVTVDRPMPSDPDGVEFYFFMNLLDGFSVDNGQRSHFYDEGRLIPEGTQNAIASVRVKFKYYTHTAGDFFTIDSITDSTEKANYDGRFSSYRLRDCVDFRPVKACSGAITLGQEFSSGTGAITGKPPAEGSALFTDLIAYLPRIDKVVVDKEGKFSIVQGQTGEQVFPPEDNVNALTLFTVYMRGFMFSTFDYKVETHEYKRYQMKDIGSIDDRVKRLEYYTSLNFLEKAAADEHISDASGNILFKNGIFVDPFQGHNKANVNHPDHLCAIDKATGTLRPHSNTKNIPLRRYANDKGAAGVGTEPKQSHIVEKNSIYTLKYSNTPFIEQPYAANSIKINPYNIFTWGGVMHLSPDSDEWIDTVHRPDIVEDQTGVYNSLMATLLEENALGTIWNHWETTHVGVESQLVSSSKVQLEAGGGGDWRDAVTHNGVQQAFNQTHSYNHLHIDVQSLANNTNDGWFDTGINDSSGRRMLVDTDTYADTEFHNQSRDGFRNDVVIDTKLESQGTKIVETHLIPFIRPREVYFRAEHLKPNTKFYPFFDGIDVSTYCKGVAFGYGADGFVEWTQREAIENIQKLMNNESIEGQSELISDAGGKLFGMFQIPNNVSGLRFKAGTREFRLSDDSNNDTTIELSYAESNYYSQGKINHLEETIHSTRVPKVETTHLNEERVIKGDTTTRVKQKVKYIDPLAQTFICDQSGGLFTTKLDLFIAGADTTGGAGEKNSIPLRVSLREVENGIPTQKIIPGADVTVYYNSNTLGHPAGALQVGDTYQIHTVGTSTWANAGWLANQVGPDGELHGANPAVGDSFICTHASNAAGNGIARAENTCYAGMITSDSSVACPIKWEHPVYLSEASEYAIVLIASSELWKTFFSETGQFDITPAGGASPALIVKQPYNGVFFTSQNASTWTPHQLRDLKFNLYRANFTTNTSTSAANFKANFVNDVVEGQQLKNNPFTYVRNPNGTTTVIRVSHPNHGMYTGNQVGAAASTNGKVVFSGFPTTDNGIANSVINATAGHTIHDIEHDSYCITVTDQATTTGIIGGGSNIFATSNAQFNTLHVYNENFQPAGTSLIATFNATTGKSVDGASVGLGNQALNYQPVSGGVIPLNIALNENRDIPFPCVIASTINETTHASPIASTYDKKSFGLAIAFTSDNSFISPVVDGRRCSLFATQNRTNDATCYDATQPNGNVNYYYNNSGTLIASETSTQNSYYNNAANAGRFYTPNTKAVGTDDINSYITNNIILKNNSAELRVLANVYLPVDTKVYLYYKASESISGEFELADWVYANPTNDLSIASGYDNAEWIITPPKSFTAFALKIVLMSKDSSNVPMVRNFRAIAAI